MINVIKIDEVEYVRKDSVQEVPVVHGDYVILRCRNAGVHAGYLESRDGTSVTLKNSRRLWRWWSKFTLSGLAMTGILKGKEKECMFSCVVPKNVFTLSDVCEQIYCTDVARQSIESIKEHAN